MKKKPQSEQMFGFSPYFKPLPHHIVRLRRVAFLTMLIERLWPCVQPLLLLLLIFLNLAWFGVFPFLPLWLHAALLGIFALAFLAALYPFFSLRRPNLKEIDCHIEQKTGLKFQPLIAQSDEISFASEESTVLWYEHRRRMRAKLQDLQIGTPDPQIPKRDPHALRALCFLSFAIAFAYSFSPHSGRLNEAFTFAPSPMMAQSLRIDGWINLPEYTGLAPIYLNMDMQGEGRETFAIPQGSVVHFRIINGQDNVRLWQETKARSRNLLDAEISSPHETAELYQLPLMQDVSLQLSTSSGQKDWFFTVMPDQMPRIEWGGLPRRALNGMLELSYQVEDDYGATKVWANVKQRSGEDNAEILPLYDAPQIMLAIPHDGKGQASHRHDFTNHPWAGMKAEITLYVEDGAGQISASKPVALTLPQRAFGNALARAVVEQRRLLVQDPNNRDLVADMLAALLIRPQDTIRNASHVIALQSAWTRLSFIGENLTNRKQLRDFTDYLWQIALAIENDGFNEAERHLKQASQALRDALRDGASSSEIERLVQELRQAMQDYIAALADRQSLNSLSEAKGMEQFLRNDDLEQKLKQLQEMAQLGSRVAAEQLLSELENLLDNLQIVQSQGGAGEGERNRRSIMQENMDNLADMLRRQQEMMNETNRLTQEWLRDEQNDEDYTQEMEGLAQQQEALRGEWEGLSSQLQSQDMERGEAMQEAERYMGQARQDLEESDGMGATGNQGQALEAMRRAGQQMMQALREQMGHEQGHSSDVDPLGRPRQDGQSSQEGDIKLPMEMDIETARRILDEIRARLGHLTPQLERQYLERLLKFD